MLTQSWFLKTRRKSKHLRRCILFTNFLLEFLKVAYFQKVQFVFQISQSPKSLFQITIMSLKFNFSTNNSKPQIQIFKLSIVFLEYFLKGRSGDLKNTSYFLKKATFSLGSVEFSHLWFWKNILCWSLSTLRFPPKN